MIKLKVRMDHVQRRPAHYAANAGEDNEHKTKLNAGRGVHAPDFTSRRRLE